MNCFLFSRVNVGGNNRMLGIITTINAWKHKLLKLRPVFADTTKSMLEEARGCAGEQAKEARLVKVHQLHLYKIFWLFNKKTAAWWEHLDISTVSLAHLKKTFFTTFCKSVALALHLISF